MLFCSFARPLLLTETGRLVAAWWGCLALFALVFQAGFAASNGLDCNIFCCLGFEFTGNSCKEFDC